MAGVYTKNGATSTNAGGLIATGTNNIQLNGGTATYVNGVGTFGGVNSYFEFPNIGLSNGNGGTFTYTFMVAGEIRDSHLRHF